MEVSEGATKICQSTGSPQISLQERFIGRKLVGSKVLKACLETAFAEQKISFLRWLNAKTSVNRPLASLLIWMEVTEVQKSVR